MLATQAPDRSSRRITFQLQPKPIVKRRAAHRPSIRAAHVQSQAASTPAPNKGKGRGITPRPERSIGYKWARVKGKTWRGQESTDIDKVLSGERVSVGGSSFECPCQTDCNPAPTSGVGALRVGRLKSNVPFSRLNTIGFGIGICFNKNQPFRNSGGNGTSIASELISHILNE